ncbi:MAG TPA: hypothetical protein VII12_06085 [Thermoanaerobaculia bacterium]|jgi:hypothetical protein
MGLGQSNTSSSAATAPSTRPTWTLGGPGFSYSGWERIKILSPNAGFLSNKAEFRGHSSKPEWQDLIVTSASLGNKALVQAMAQDKAGWGNGVFINALPPGASQTVDIPVYYLMSDPAFMVNNAPHSFMAIADPLGLVTESDESNNKKGPINMGPPANCPRPQPNP